MRECLSDSLKEGDVPSGSGVENLDLSSDEKDQ